MFCCHFFSFYFLNALQSDINSNRVNVLGHKYVLGSSQTHFSPRLAAWAKMSLSRAQNIYAQEHKRYCYIFVNAVKILTSDVSASLFYRVALKQRLQAQIDSACAFGV